MPRHQARSDHTTLPTCHDLSTSKLRRSLETENVGMDFGCLSENFLVIPRSPHKKKHWWLKMVKCSWILVQKIWFLGFKRAHPEVGAKAIARMPKSSTYSNSSTCHWKIQHVDGTCTYKDTLWWLYIAILMHMYIYMARYTYNTVAMYVCVYIYIPLTYRQIAIEFCPPG